MRDDDDEDLMADDVDPDYRERQLAKRAKAVEKEKRKQDYLRPLCEQGTVIQHFVVFHADTLEKADDLARDVAGRFQLFDPITIEGEVGEGWNITFTTNALADPGDVWDVNFDEWLRIKHEWAAIGERYGFSVISVDETDVEDIYDESVAEDEA